MGWKVQTREDEKCKLGWKVQKGKDEKWCKSRWGDENCKIGWKVKIKEKMKSGANLVEEMKTAKLDEK